MKNFNMHIPTKVYFGEGAIKDLSIEIKKYGNRVLMVYGHGSIKRNGVYDDVMAAFELGDITYVELSGVDVNPRLETVNEGVRICLSEKIDFILAVGGGSVVDCSKTIAAAVYYAGDPWDLVSYKTKIQKAMPLGVVLTLSATGSELNGNAVISNTQTKEKRGFSSEWMWPKFSILDPTYTYTVSPHQTACGIVDTLTHLYEFYFSAKEDAELSDAMSEAVMATVIKYGKIAIAEPNNYEARSNLMWASAVALSGMTNRGKTFEGFNHAVEHGLSAIYDITHADGLAILAPYWMEYVLDEKNVTRFARFARKVWGIVDEDDMGVAKKGIERTRRYYEYLEMPSRLSHVKIDDARLDAVIDHAFLGDTLGHLKILRKQDVRRILEAAL
ncbi:MAG: iron-containing alcohol dehydrogenase [Vallitaleaceae bacterium]|nr:iron-containing alcohol dehydrogenase [Vallitaleaceae bacterium]